MENKNAVGKRKAVAVKYDDGIEVPIIMAKGQGAAADKIIYEAEKNNITLTENKPLVDLLGIENVGSQVPEEAWTALAEIFAFILENNGEK